MAIRAAFLEQENIQLKWEVAKLKKETEDLRTAILNSAPAHFPGMESDWRSQFRETFEAFLFLENDLFAFIWLLSARFEALDLEC